MDMRVPLNTVKSYKNFTEWNQTPSHLKRFFYIGRCVPLQSPLNMLKTAWCDRTACCFALKPVFILVLLFLTACKEDQPHPGYAPEILSPREDAFYFPDETLWVKAIAEPGYGVGFLEVFIDGSSVFGTDQPKVDTLLRNLDLREGAHVLNLKSEDADGNTGEASVGFQVVDNQDRAGAVETFNLESCPGWFFSNWSPDNSSGYDDNHALQSISANATAMVKKQFEESGSVSFYVRSGAGNLEFIVDGQLKSKWFGKEGWGYYAYSVPEGKHVFKWVAEKGGTSIDKVQFTPGIKQHTPGEVYGGGTIFFLDSTGQHGLIAALNDGMYGGNYEIPWGCYGLAITSGSRAQSPADGAGNTLAIVTDCNLEHIAARYCFDLVTTADTHVFDDWYLPAIDELRMLYKNRDKVENLEGEYYWSSTSFSTSAASVIKLSDGKHHGANRNIPNNQGPSVAGIHVRPVRKF